MDYKEKSTIPRGASTLQDMDINSLLAEPAPERRSSSNAQSVTAPSPSTSSAKLPSPPPPSTKRKRGRHDPKPIWAILEHEPLPDDYVPPRPKQHSSPQLSRPSPSIARPPPPTQNHRVNGAPAPTKAKLSGYERPITNDDFVYDEVTRRVCDFIWASVVQNPPVRAAVAEDPGIEVEIEARWGQVLDPISKQRLLGLNETECVVRDSVAHNTTFVSTMSLAQHKRMNDFLNNHVALSRNPANQRDPITYKHTKEGDRLYELDQAGFDSLHPVLRELFAQGPSRQRIRITRDLKTGEVVRRIIKYRIANLEISSPATEWDYRIGINLEVQYRGSMDNLRPIVEAGRSVESMERKKDRMSYAYRDAYQIDLTQVTQGSNKNHELELELNGARVLQEADLNARDLPNKFEELVRGLMNNLRVLSREITPPAGPQ